MKKNIILFLLLFTFIGCSRIYLTIVTPKNVKKSLKVFEKGDAKIIYLPMVHLAKPKFFDQVKTVVDSLKKEDYTVFYEQISIYESEQKDTLDINLRKLRKMLGVNVFGGYNNKENENLPNYYKNKKFISQENQDLGLDSLDIIADVSLKELIRLRELKEGKIVLTACDFETDLNEKYKCETVSKFYAMRVLRDSIAANIVIKANKKKSLVIYGKGHYYGLYANFRDAGFIFKE